MRFAPHLSSLPPATWTREQEEAYRCITTNEREEWMRSLGEEESVEKKSEEEERERIPL